ncbi:MULTISPECIES: DUF2877 domain-containing protein [Anaerotruncus]|uniref:oxamate carbamoyltransferase subunit AllH family protein n=1 Tax=Anaerotruncus TaxID=244127 RepID=UPI0015556597|nr:DUF2877 domain-containing protein [Anaerotruncus massiliensis (ex Togo et al. 2019)]
MCRETDEGAVPALEVCHSLRRSIPAGGCPATVHSVFDRAVNLVTPLGLVTLLPKCRPLYPFSVRIDTDIPFPALGLRPDMSAMLLPGEASAGMLHVDLTNALDTDLSVLERKELIVPPDLSDRLERLAGVIGEEGKPEGMAPLVFHLEEGSSADYAERFPHNHYTAFLLPRVRRLFDALHTGQIVEISAAAGAMAGCGPGLTPSSDDFLCGMMAAMLARGGARGRVLRTMDITQRMGCAARVKTNVISGSFLIRSSQGLLSADVLDTVGQLFSNGPTQSLESAASRVITFGETSGTDILSGIYFGAKI